MWWRKPWGLHGGPRLASSGVNSRQPYRAGLSTVQGGPVAVSGVDEDSVRRAQGGWRSFRSRCRMPVLASPEPDVGAGSSAVKEGGEPGRTDAGCCLCRGLCRCKGVLGSAPGAVQAGQVCDGSGGELGCAGSGGGADGGQHVPLGTTAVADGVHQDSACDGSACRKHQEPGSGLPVVACGAQEAGDQLEFAVCCRIQDLRANGSPQLLKVVDACIAAVVQASTGCPGWGGMGAESTVAPCQSSLRMVIPLPITAREGRGLPSAPGWSASLRAVAVSSAVQGRMSNGASPPA